VNRFDELITPCLPQLRALCRTMTHTPDDAEDALQDSLIRIYQRLDTFRGDCSFATWAFTVCRSACIDRRRSDRLQTVPLSTLEDDEGKALERVDVSPEADPLGEVLAEEGCRELWRAIRKLPAGQREVLKLSLRGLEYEEIAETLKVPVGTVKSRLARGRVLLRSVLASRQSSCRSR
jgi:RNA polymerase sigma-70 factor (ECF subfamily)